MKRAALGAFASVSILTATLASAASISVVPVYSGAYDSNLTPLAAGAPIQAGSILQFDIRFSVSGLSSQDNFGNVAFNIGLSSGLEAVDMGSGKWMSPATAAGYGLYNGFASPPGALPGFAQYNTGAPGVASVANHWQVINADVGPNKNDLTSVLICAGRQEAANRQYGEAGRPADQLGSPTLLGSVLVKYLGGEPTLSITSGPGQSWSTLQNNLGGNGLYVAQPRESFIGGSVAIPSLITTLVATEKEPAAPPPPAPKPPATQPPPTQTPPPAAQNPPAEPPAPQPPANEAGKPGQDSPSPVQDTVATQGPTQDPAPPSPPASDSSCDTPTLVIGGPDAIMIGYGPVRIDWSTVTLDSSGVLTAIKLWQASDANFELAGGTLSLAHTPYTASNNAVMATPEPASFVLAALAILGMAAFARRIQPASSAP